MEFNKVKKFISNRHQEHWGKFANSGYFWEFLLRDLENERKWDRLVPVVWIELQKLEKNGKIKTWDIIKLLEDKNLIFEL